MRESGCFARPRATLPRENAFWGCFGTDCAPCWQERSGGDCPGDDTRNGFSGCFVYKGAIVCLGEPSNLWPRAMAEVVAVSQGSKSEQGN
jgi:hypothetical protein